MATGVLPAPFSGVKSSGPKLGFGKSLNIVRICDLRSLRSARRRVSVICNSNQGSDLAELQPASEGSPLLGNRCIRDAFRLSFLAFFFLFFRVNDFVFYIGFCSAKTEILRVIA